MPAPQRLDQALVQRGLVASRSRARDLVLRGHALVNGEVCAEPAAKVAEKDAVALAPDAPIFVSRGAEKLRHALDAWALSAQGKVALDVGSSTGGFTQVLLARGARKVYAVDVGHGQLAAPVRDDPRVVSLEGTDARSLQADQIPDAIEAIVADVSFISLTKALPAALTLAAPGCWLVALVKPQFEAGREAVGKGGIVRDEADRLAALDHVRTWLAGQPGWRPLGALSSPITGGSGNVEFLIGAVHD